VSGDDDDVALIAHNALRRLVRSVGRRVRRLGGALLTRVARLTGAAVAAYLVALVALDDPRPVLAPLTALLVVQATLAGTVADTIRRILSVVAGVGVAIAFSTFVGFTWWSLALLVAASILVGQLLRLGQHLLEVPISAMLVLAVGGSHVAALDRVNATIVGAAVGLLVNLIFPPAVQTRTAGAAVEEYAIQLARLLERVADEIRQPVNVDQVVGWLQEAREVAGELPRMEEVLASVAESRRLNPRAIRTPNLGPDLRSGLDALEHSAVALRALFRSLADRAREQSDLERLYDRDVSEAFTALLGDLAIALRDFGKLVRAEAEEQDRPPTAELGTAVESARETRAMLAELLTVDPRADPNLWLLHGALLAGADRVLRELDLEERDRQRERLRREDAEESSPAAVAVERLRTAAATATRTVTDVVSDAVAELPRQLPQLRQGGRRSDDLEE
jgi:Aromatic acid exporter family member 1